ncbi:MAG: hypothetical protein A2201_03565, partial [Alicyclobacillus sp. RIFOXYA1_FULL_53_8]
MALDVQAWSQLGHAIFGGLVGLFANPLLYLAFAAMVWDVAKNAKYERRFFGVRVTKVWGPLLRRLILSFALGLAFTVLAALAGTIVRQNEMWIISGLTLLLAGIRLRFFASAYSISLFLAVVLVNQFVPSLTSGTTFSRLGALLAQVHVAGWLGIAAAIFLAEALFLTLHRNAAATPAVVTTKRGRSIGATVLQLPFIVPMLSVGAGSHVLPAWTPAMWPWLGTLAHGYTFVGAPFIVGFSAVLLAVPGTIAIRTTARWSLVTGLILAVDAYATHRFGAMYGWVGVVAAVAGRELPLWRLRKSENTAEPLFAPSPDGVRVLMTRPGSLAESMPLLPAEVITHVNQVPVHSNYD